MLQWNFSIYFLQAEIIQRKMYYIITVLNFSIATYIGALTTIRIGFILSYACDATN